MMDRVIEETASRGKAENDKAAIERELAELSSSLFAEANSMVAIERMERLRAERKMEELDRNLKDTESLMTSQGDQMRDLGGKIDELETEREELKKRLEELEEAANAREAAVEDADQDATANSSMISITASEGDPPRTPLSATFSPQNGINSLQLALPPNVPIPTTPGSALSTLRSLPPVITHPIQYLSFDIAPFQEFVVFTKSLARIRKNITTRPSYDAQGHNPYAYGAYSAGYTGNPNAGVLHNVGLSASEQKEAMNNALPLTQYIDFPFIKRVITEDSEPSLRLDNAPGLTFFSRRQVTNAIIDGNLAIEPAFTSIPSDQCAICGMSLAKFIASHQTTAPKDDPRKKLTRLATGWIPQAISGTATPTKEAQAEKHKSTEWSISSLSDALQGALTPAKELGGFNFSIGGSDKPSEKQHGHYTPYTGANSRPGTSSGAGSMPERRPSNLSRLSAADGLPASRPTTPNPGAGAGGDAASHQGTFFLTNAAKQHVQIYLFRTVDSNTKYAVCPTLCLPRLRAVCELWTYIRTVEKGLLSEDAPKFYPSNIGSSASEYAQQVKKLSNTLVPPQSAVAVVKGLATPAIGTSKQLGVDPPSSAAGWPAGASATQQTPVLGNGLQGMAPLTKTTSNSSAKSERSDTQGLGLDIEKKDFAYDASTNPSTESIASSAASGQKEQEQSTAATSVESLSTHYAAGPAETQELDLTPNAETAGSRRTSVDQTQPPSGTVEGFNLTLPPARPKRNVARGVATPTSASSPAMASNPSSDTVMGSPAVGSDTSAKAAPPVQATPKPASPPQLPARNPSISESPAVPAFGTSPAQAGAMAPPRLPARPALPKIATVQGGDKSAIAISTKDADWQQRCWYEIVRLKEVTL